MRWMKRLELLDNTHNSKTSLYENTEDDGLGGSLSLLKTIKLPKNLKLLSDRLPKSKYGEVDNSRSSYLAETSSIKSIRTNPDE